MNFLTRARSTCDAKEGSLQIAWLHLGERLPHQRRRLHSGNITAWHPIDLRWILIRLQAVVVIIEKKGVVIVVVVVVVGGHRRGRGQTKP